jgi:hypothetical protein
MGLLQARHPHRTGSLEGREQVFIFIHQLILFEMPVKSVLKFLFTYTPFCSRWGYSDRPHEPHFGHYLSSEFEIKRSVVVRDG